MPITITVRAGEDLAEALGRFQQLVAQEYGRPWTKRRYWYYEPPSALRRKQRKMRQLRAQRRGGLWLRIGLAAQWRRTGPPYAAGR